MKNNPKPPRVYETFVRRYPKLGEAWENIAQAGSDGPLDPKTARLIKLAVAMGSGVRKALAAGISKEEIEQTIALAAGTLGMPSTVAVFTWVHDELDKR